jgi:hypothetical protein
MQRLATSRSPHSGEPSERQMCVAVAATDSSMRTYVYRLTTWVYRWLQDNWSGRRVEVSELRAATGVPRRA